jgi:hypothetical protein
MNSESDAAVRGGGRVNQGLNNWWNSSKFGGIGLVRICENLIKIPLTTVFTESLPDCVMDSESYAEVQGGGACQPRFKQLVEFIKIWWDRVGPDL